LLLFRDTFRGETAQWYARELLARNLTPEQFEIRSEWPPDGHLSIYHEIDISLDTFPWSGHTTSCESLWMGAPVVTLAGDRRAGRMVSSVLTELNLHEWIAGSLEQYLEIATRLAADLPALAEWRSQLRRRIAESSLCDAPAFARSVEAAFRSMWRIACQDRAAKRTQES
jgi:predicted O-linked N-acetylglucosamine transferase (SPINDLY family)